MPRGVQETNHICLQTDRLRNRLREYAKNGKEFEKWQIT